MEDEGGRMKDVAPPPRRWNHKGAGADATPCGTEASRRICHGIGFDCLGLTAWHVPVGAYNGLARAGMERTPVMGAGWPKIKRWSGPVGGAGPRVIPAYVD